MTRGFITIATGKEQYYRLAANLLMSYRYFAEDPLPFAIISEEENQYTSLFDDVIITSESTHSFMDKFLLLKLCPYDENIFLDADCLAYGDLNKYWDFFENATDFSCVGVNVPRDQRDGAWYNVEDIGDYGKKLEYKVRVHAGVFFLRRSEKLKRLYENCMDINSHYHELYFHTCPGSRDECILGVAMPLNGMKAVRESRNMIIFYSLATYLEADILHGILKYKTQWYDMVEKGLLLHWGTAYTKTPLYRYNAACLHYMTELGKKQQNIIEKLWYEKKLMYKALLSLSTIRKFFERVLRVIKRYIVKIGIFRQ